MSYLVYPVGALAEWTELLTAVGALGSALGLGAGFKWGYAWWLERKARGTVDEIQLGYRISVELDSVREHLGGDRAIIVRAHNGGGEIKAARPLFTTSAFQRNHKRLPRVDWVGEPVDDDHWKVLKRVADAGGKSILLRVEDLSEDSALGSLYRATGITHSYVFELYATPKEYWYVTVNRTVESEMVDEHTAHEVVRVARQHLVRLLRDRKLRG